MNLKGMGFLEITFVLIVLYLVLTRSQAFARIAGSLGSTYIGAVKALQGR